MNYFEKIESYTEGSLSEMECSIFEEELNGNPSLQQELEAFKLAQSLFDFVGKELSEELITAPESTALADLLVDFTANNLSEEQILANNSITAKKPIIHTLQPRANRTAWLVAASMLFILSLIGSQFYGSQNLEETSLVAIIPAPIEKAPIKAIASISSTLETEVIVAAMNSRKTIQAKNYSPKDVKVVKKTKPITINHNNSNQENRAIDTEKLLSEKMEVSPLVMNTVAKEITTSSVLSEGQAIAYKATNSITLKAGFTAQAGTSFSAETDQERVPQEVNSAVTISETESIIYKANTSITLKPGFHAKAGAAFKAEIGT